MAGRHLVRRARSRRGPRSSRSTLRPAIRMCAASPGLSSTRSGSDPLELFVKDDLRTTTAVPLALLHDALRPPTSRRRSPVRRHGGVLRPGVDREKPRRISSSIPAGRASPWRATHCRSWTRTAGLDGSPGCDSSGSSTPGSLARCATRRSSTSRARTSPHRTCWTLESGTFGEYDGAVHLAGKQRARDVARENKLRNLGLESFTILADDIGHPERPSRRWSDARRGPSGSRSPRGSGPSSPPVVDADPHR